MDDTKIDEIECQLPLKNMNYIAFKGTNYPIDIQIFQTYSLFFSRNPSFQNKHILSFDYPSIITSDSFESFINACQNRKFIINKVNAIPLHYLSKQFEVPMLIKTVEDFIEQNHKQLLLECFKYKVFYIQEFSERNESSNANRNATIDDDNFFKFTYEIETIGESLSEYLKNEEFSFFLLSLPIPTFYKIIQHYTNTHSQDSLNLNDSTNDDNNNNNNQIRDFISEYIRKNGTQASIIFSLFHFEIDDIKKFEKSQDLKIDYSFFCSSLDTNEADIKKQNQKFREDTELNINKLKDQISKIKESTGGHDMARKIIDDLIYQKIKDIND